jgi:hypothetical protein
MKKAGLIFVMLLVLFLLQKCCASVSCGDSSIHLPFQLIDKTTSKDIIYDLGAILNNEVAIVGTNNRIVNITKSDTLNGKFLLIQLLPEEKVISLKYKNKNYDLSIGYTNSDSKCCSTSYVTALSSLSVEIAINPNKTFKGVNVYALSLHY